MILCLISKLTGKTFFVLLITFRLTGAFYQRHRPFNCSKFLIDNSCMKLYLCKNFDT